MGRFNASLRLPGDSQGISAVVELEDGRLKLASGDHVIGDWDLASVELVGSPEGMRLRAEGETVLLQIQDRTAFEAETARIRNTRRPHRARRAKTEKAASGPKVGKTPPGESRLDRFLAAAQGRLGSLLPDWVFTRGGLTVVLAAVVVAFVFAELVSMALLIVGVLILLLAGVCMLDDVIAARVLRHKVTPIQALIAGGSVFVAGLLIGFLP